MRSTRHATGLTLFLLAPLASSQSIAPVVVEGDSIPGVGTVTSIENLAVNSAGDWFVEVDTDNANTDLDGALIRSGLVFQREGDALAMPPGALLDGFDAVTMDTSSHGAFHWMLAGTSGTGDNAGIYFDTSLVLQKGAISMAAGFGPGTVYGTFSDCKLNDSGQILVIGLVDDPNVSGTTDWAAVVLTTDGMGNLTAETRIAGEGDLLPGQTLLVNTIRSGAHASAINHAGQVIFAADLDTGSTGDDAVVYLDLTLIAQEGSPAPVPGRTWGSLVSPEVDLNTAGQWTIKDTLDSSDTSTDGIIVLTGAKFMQEGDTLPAIAPFTFTGFGNGPAALTESGQVLWYGDWNDPDLNVDEGLFLDDVLLVQQGVTQIGGLTVIDVGDQTENYGVSDDGRFVIFEATLTGGLEGAFVIDLIGGVSVASGADLLRTPGDQCTYQSFLGNPIPADFFGPGSQPFEDSVLFRGEPLSGSGLVGDADTIVQRHTNAQLPSCGSSDTVPIEIVALHLQSIAPITVDFGGPTSRYDVTACLSSTAVQSIGSMTITQTHASGGEYTSTLPVTPRLVFTKVSGAMGAASVVLDPAPEVIFDVPSLVAPVPGVWVFDGSVMNVPASPGGMVDHDCEASTPLVFFAASSNFTPGIAIPGADCAILGGPPELQLQREEAIRARHCVVPVGHPGDDVPYCFCYPEVAPCNNPDIDAGCRNSTGAGALLSKSGSASILTDTLVLTATSVPNQPGLFFQGTAPVFGFFGDGNRCAGDTVVRLVTILAQGNCAATDRSCGTQVGGTGGPISDHPGNAALVPGDTRYYQFWFRDPAGPCGFDFNLSNAYSVLWGI